MLVWVSEAAVLLQCTQDKMMELKRMHARVYPTSMRAESLPVLLRSFQRPRLIGRWVVLVPLLLHACTASHLYPSIVLVLS